MAERAVRITQFEAGLVAAMLDDRARGGEWFGPGQPVSAVAPEDVKGRKFDYQVSANVNYRPKSEATELGLEYAIIRRLCDPTQGGLDILRGAIETVKDKMSTQAWTIKPRDKDGDKKKSERIQLSLRRPDGILTMRQWQRCLLEDHLTIDHPFIYKSPTGKGFVPEILDGATIKLLLDGDGRRPMRTEDAYQQILHGMVGSAYTPQELFHFPYNVLPQRAYAMGRVEQFIGIINIALRRQTTLSQYYSEGNVPDALIGVPETWTAKQIGEFQEYWDDLLSGNSAERRHAKFVPGGMVPTFTRDPKLKDDTDDYLSRVLCWCYGLSPGALVREMTRATAQTQKTAAAEEGLEPVKGWFKDVMDVVLEEFFDASDQEFAYQDEEIQDPLIKAQVFQIALGGPGKAWLTIDEVREKVGELPMTADQEEELKPEPVAPPPAPGLGLDGKPPVPGGKKPAPEDSGIGQKVEKMAKAARRSRRDRPAMIKQEGKVALGISKRLHKLSKSIIPQIVEAYGAIEKAAGDDARARKIASTLKKEDLQDLQDYLQDQGEATFSAGVLLAADELQKRANDEMVNLANEKASVWASDHAGDLIKDFASATKSDIESVVSKALEEGWPNDKLADALEDSWSFSAQRSEVIARTETAFADVQGNAALYAEAGVEEVTWITADSDPCDECDDMDGKTLPVDGDLPPAHPNCRCDVVPVMPQEAEDA